jgi:hypothetical protein
MTPHTDEEPDRVLAADEGTSRQGVSRGVVRELSVRGGHAARVTDSAERLASRWRNVLHRLGTM